MSVKRWKVLVDGKPTPHILYAATAEAAQAQANAIVGRSSGVRVADIDASDSLDSLLRGIAGFHSARGQTNG